MEIPWAADLTHLGLAALFLDRRGHGGSGGGLWPPAITSGRLDDREPDIAAAVAYLRAQPFVDPERIALFGHSDGATAALIAASADWGVRATVAVSASVAPSEFINHVAPENMLLVYGADDHFILNSTDSALIARGTRGLLAGPGQLGSFTDGSARRLMRVAGRGHLDVLYSADAQRTILEWLRDSLQTGEDVVVSKHRWNWIWLGLAGLCLLLLWVPGRTAVRFGKIGLGAVARGSRSCSLERSRGRSGQNVSNLRAMADSRANLGEPAMDRQMLVRAALLIAVWVSGLLFAPWLARQGEALVPAHEGAVFAALLLGPGVPLVLGVALCVFRRRVVRWPGRPALARAAASGMLTAAFVFGAVHLLLLHHYAVRLDLARVVLLLLFTGVGLPVFAALEGWLHWVHPNPTWLPASTLVALATVTAALSGELFERMSIAPAYLLAAALVVCAVYRLRPRAGVRVSCPILGALTIGWLGAVVCVFY